MKNRIIFLCCFLLYALFAQAQHLEWDDFLNSYLSNETDNDNETTSYDIVRLEEMHEKPLNVNDCSKEDLVQIPCINEAEVDSIFSYIKRYGPIRSVGELTLIRGIDFECRSILPLFIFFGDEPLQHKKQSLTYQLSHATQEVATALSIPFYKRQGFGQTINATTGAVKDAQYLGSPLSGSLRYRINYGQDLTAGLTAKQDDGEAFAQSGNVLFDSYSFYFIRRHTHSVIRTWAVGDYRIHFGKGLTTGVGFMNSGLALLSSRHDHGQGVFAHSGTDEYHFLRGGAIQLAFQRFTVTLYASMRQLDGRLQGDSLLSVNTSGYHRLPLERERKNNVENAVAGASTHFKIRQLTLGCSAVYSHYNHPFICGDKAYQRYNLNGSDFKNASFYFNYGRRKINFGGETAISGQGSWAALHDLRLQLPSNLRLYLQHRYYGKAYQAPQAWAYSGGGKCRGEHGAMVGIAWNPRRAWGFTGLIDGYRLTTATYNANIGPSNAYTLLGQVNYQASQKLRFTLRYRLRSRQECSTKYLVLLYAMKHQMRVQSQYTLGSLSLTTTLDGCSYKPAVGYRETGGLISERISATLWGIKCASAFTIFHTDSYDAALSAYQPSLLYTHSYSSFFYHGYAGTFTFQKRLGRHYDLSAAISMLHYTNKDTIGSAERTIPSSTKCDAALQFRWLF